LVREGLRDEVLDIVRILGELDALRSMALAGEIQGWATPELVESSEFLLEARDAYHPFVNGATPNPIELKGGEPHVFLTGPNMAGKTTYLKTVALLVLLAQTGMKVPASWLRLAPIEVLFTGLNTTDDLRQGISYFYAEILRVREAAAILARGQKALVLFDEVFKGTNVKDALEASAQVIEGFAKTRRSGSIFASHLSELHETLRTNPAVRFCQFDGEIVGGVPVFRYELVAGVSDKRFGLLLLRQAQVPELIARISA
jgi:DNA mismatch repair ATPase MutS